MNSKLFAIGYVPHRLWGNIFLAQVLEREDNAAYYVPRENLIYDENLLSFQRLSPMQREVLYLIDQYNEKKLHRLFSKKPTVKAFHDSVDSDTIKHHIRPYIEKQLYKVLQVAAENRMRVFVGGKSNRNIFRDDFLTLHRRPANPTFYFRREEEQTIYSLSITSGGEPVNLNVEHPHLVSNQPAAVILNNDLFFVDDIEGNRLLPFFTKDEVVIPRSAEKKYFNTFVKNTLKAYDFVQAEGFEVREKKPRKKAVLTLETGMNRHPAFVLRLHYEQYNLFPSSSQVRFVDFNADGDRFHFTRFTRDVEWEEALDMALQEAGLKTRDQTSYLLRKTADDADKDAVYQYVNFINENAAFLEENGIEVRQKMDREYFMGSMELEISSEERNDWFDIHGVVKLGSWEIPFIKLRNHILHGNRLYELPDGTVAVIPREWFARYTSLFEFGKVSDPLLKVHKQHFSLVDEALRKEHARTIAHLDRLNTRESLPSPDMPKGLRADMRTYQLEGFSWLCYLQQNGFGGCLADDMGLGKTLQTLAILLKNKEEYISASNQDPLPAGQLSLFGGDQPRPTSLIVVPASLMHNWINELSRFAPSLEFFLYAGNQRDKSLKDFSSHDVVISSYHTVRQDIQQIRDFAFHYVILDESQMIKNPSSKLYRAMEELQSDHKLVLTGTPIENSLTDLWSQINFVNEGLLGSLHFFRKQFVQPIEKKKNKSQEQRLKELINPFILRRTKEEVAKELPPVYEQFRYCNMTEEQARWYEEEKSSVRNSLLENFEEIGLEQSTMMVLKALTRLRQISNHPLMVDEEYEHGSGKFDEVHRGIDSILEEKHKVLVFSSFVKHLKLFAHAFDREGTGYALLTGSTRDREEQVKRFQEEEDCRIFLISLKAGGVGLNLTAADYVFILDPWWNPAAEMQALNRAHRIGQDKNVFVYRFISNHSIEEKIQRLQQRKSELAKTFVTSNNPLKNMQKEEILELFS